MDRREKGVRSPLALTATYYRRLDLPAGTAVFSGGVASHDTASAVIASPLANKHSAYLSSGARSLMGFEKAKCLHTDEALAANITNEGGAEGEGVIGY